METKHCDFKADASEEGIQTLEILSKSLSLSSGCFSISDIQFLDSDPDCLSTDLRKLDLDYFVIKLGSGPIPVYW